MDKFITILMDDKEKVFRILCLIISALSTMVCDNITDSLWITRSYTVFTMLFCILELFYMDKVLESIINFFWKYEKVLFCFFVIIALLPVIVGLMQGEIVFESLTDFVEIMLNNPVSNILGVLIVFSLMKYLSKICTVNDMYLMLRSKKHFFDVVLQFGFILSFLNAINYTISDKLKWTNIFNSIHLFCIMFLGVIVAYIFVLRLADKTPFEQSVKRVYPTFTLIFTWLFLVSCGLSPIVFGRVKHELMLLIFNTIAALVVVWLMFFLVKRKTKKENGYPYTAPSVFTLFILLNLFANIFWGEYGFNKEMQFISGFFVLLIVLTLCISIFINKSKNVNE